MKSAFFAFILLMVILISCRKNPDPRTQIAIITPVTHPSLEQIEKGFRKTMEEKNPNEFHFVTYNGQGNKTLMRSEVEEIAQQNYQLVFTIGTTATQMTKEVFEKRGIATPIIFTAVNDPVGFNIVLAEENPGKNISGVKELLRFDEELAALLKYCPKIQNILLVYNPTEPGMDKDQKQVKRILDQKGINLQSVEVFQTNELLIKTLPFIDKADALIVLKDNTVVSGLEVLVKLCNQHRIPLMASDLDSPDRGAAFAYGVYEIEFGIEGAKQALRLLLDQQPPNSLPVTSVKNFTLRINTEAAEKQGVKLP